MVTCTDDKKRNLFKEEQAFGRVTKHDKKLKSCQLKLMISHLKI